MKQLTENFSDSEFLCKCGCVIPDELQDNLFLLVLNLQIIRDYIDQPISVSSGYRCVKHNRKVGGKPKSYHLSAMAADIKAKDYTPKELAKKIKELIDKKLILAGGLKAYTTFTHYDFRGKYVTW